MHASLKHLNPQHQPDIVWEYDTIDELIPAEVHRVTDHFNATEFHELLQPLRELVQTDQKTGLDYALLVAEGNSKDSAIIHFNPFANGMDDNMLTRANYLKKAFNAYEITDNHNAVLPLLSFSAPSGSPGIKLTRHHHRKTARGEFGALAKHYIAIIKRLGFKELRIIGFSQGATIAAAVGATAPDFGLTVSHIALGEPANVMKRPRRQLVRDFRESAKHLNPAIDASGIEHLKHFYGDGSDVKYMIKMARMGRLNINIVSGLSKATFANDLEKILHSGTTITLGWGGLDAVSPAERMRVIVAESRHSSNTHDHAIHTIQINNAHHAWADRLNVLATFYSYALVR